MVIGKHRKKLSHFLDDLHSLPDVDKFIDYIEQCVFKGTTNGVIAKNSPIRISAKMTGQLLDHWYPGYNELSTPQRRKWVTTNWPLMHMENSVRWKNKVHTENPDHPIFKHFIKINMMNYYGQKSMALKRGVEWKFDFLSWIVWWINTGHFDQRGVMNNEYQMCRVNDTGPYAWDNVYCDTGENNKKLYWDSLKSVEEE